MFYTFDMPRPPTPPEKPPSSFTLRLGGWLEAHGTGWGVLAVPFVVVAVLATAIARAWLG